MKKSLVVAVCIINVFLMCGVGSIAGALLSSYGQEPFVSANETNSSTLLSSEPISKDEDNAASYQQPEEKQFFVSASLTDAIVNDDEPIYADFSFNADISSYYIESKGVKVFEESKSQGAIKVTLIPENTQGVVDVYVKNEVGGYTRSSIYTYKEAKKVFTSIYSEEDARFNAVQYNYDQGAISDKEYEEYRAVFSRRDIKETITVSEDRVLADASDANTLSATGLSMAAAQDKTTYVDGNLYWQLASGSLRALSYIRVDLYDYDPIGADEYIGTTYTDVNGYYSFTFQNDTTILENGYDVYIRVYPDGRTFEIGKTWNTTAFYYFCDSSRTNNVSSGSTTNISWDIYYNSGNNHNCAFYISQGLVVAEKYMRDMLGYYPSEVVKVWFPLLSSEANSFVNWINSILPSSWNSIPTQGAFCFNTYMGVTQNYFNDWDTVMHEYGHYVEHRVGTYGITLWEHLVYNPAHSFNADDVDAHEFLWGLINSTCKSYGLQLAWSEAWAYAFAFVAQDYYNKNILSLTTSPTNVPNICDATVGVYNCETRSPYNMVCGEANEVAITCLLWDLYDSASDAADYISLGASTWWEATTASGTYTLSNFANVINDNYGYYRKEVGALFQYFGMAPGIFSVSGVTSTLSSSTSISIDWPSPGGRPTAPNNRFKIAAYNNSGTQLWISGYVSGSPYTISSSALATIRSKLPNTSTTVGFNVLGYENTSPISGPYFSETQLFSVINPLEISASTRYSEYTDSSLLGLWQTKYVMFATAGTKVIQTFGTKNTKMEVYNSSGSRIASNDNSGYSNNPLVTISVNAGERYSIKVRFNSFFAAGSFKVGIISAPSLTNYDNLPVISPSATSVTVSAPAGVSCLYTFKNTVTGSRTIYTASAGSAEDTYLYVIDPRSTSLITSADYDDDSGTGAFSSITKTFTANIPYLVIASKYYLSNNSTFLLCNS
ncbi:MAG: hypothetical protein PHC84_00015 [Clostridia bacterium]|nr:hypothetical protein [Clostridia bacterium]